MVSLHRAKALLWTLLLAMLHLLLIACQ
jgi:hypothetical protein